MEFVEKFNRALQKSLEKPILKKRRHGDAGQVDIHIPTFSHDGRNHNISIRYTKVPKDGVKRLNIVEYPSKQRSYKVAKTHFMPKTFFIDNGLDEGLIEDNTLWSEIVGQLNSEVDQVLNTKD